jgi:radical SAM superfamily enzyme YgiQ (UPF0313 family)
MKEILLINPNMMKPPVAPIAIDYLASALQAAGFGVRFLDLPFEQNIEAALRASLKDEPLYVGMTIRNIDDSYFATRDFCLARIKPLVGLIQESTSAPVVIGGVGYSIFPIEALEYLGADYGVHGDGEVAAVCLARALSGRESVASVGGLVWKEGGRYIRNNAAPMGLAAYDLSSRETVENLRYLREGGMVGFETKRGCPCSCSYCADPLAKGSTCRLRPPAQVAQELAGLAARGVTHFHTCDSEFNVPRAHAADVCRALISAGLEGKLRWYAYLNPAYFDKELAGLMRRAGCAGINFGTDHCNPSLLKSLGRKHTADAVREAALLCRRNDMASMFDLLLGSPGETPETLCEAIAFMKGTEASCVGASLGLRLYPGTRLADSLLASGIQDTPAFHGSDGHVTGLLQPTYYLSPLLGDDPYGLLSELVKDDERFFVASPARENNDYNYNNNSVLSEAIRGGERGAFWDILRRMKNRDVTEKASNSGDTTASRGSQGDHAPENRNVVKEN